MNIPKESAVPHYHMSTDHIHVEECLSNTCQVPTERPCSCNYSFVRN